MELTIGKAAGRDFSVNAQELVTGRTCIIAQSGAGKSWSIAVLCEQMCKKGIGFCLIDTEGEYFSLKDRFEIIWVGSDEGCDYDIEKVNLKELFSRSVRESLPVIFDVSEVAMQDKVARLAHILYEIASEERMPYLLIVEEADKFIPQSKDSIKKIEEISRRGRKRGLGLLVATQRPAIVTKNVLSQCNNQIIGKLSIENDLKAVDLFFSSRREVEELSTLSPGDFFVMGGLTREKMKMRFGKRDTKHRGLTPLLTPREPLPLTGPLADEDEVPASPVEGEISQEKPSEEKAEPQRSKKRASKKVVKIPERSPDKEQLSVIPLLSREEALSAAQAKARKKRLFFGSEERLISAEMISWPLIFMEVKYIRGRVRRITQTTSFIIDGIQGNCADISSGLKLRPCFSEYISLGEDALRVISALSLSGETPAEIEALTRLSQRDVGKALLELEEKKKVTTVDSVSDAPIYVPLVSHALPRLGNRLRALDVRMIPVEGKVRQRKIDEGDIRTILKVIEPTSEVVKFSPFYFPVYEILLGSEYGERRIFIDAVGGKEIALFLPS